MTEMNVTLNDTLKQKPKTWIINWIITLILGIFLVYSISDSSINWFAVGNFITAFPTTVSRFLNPDWDWMFGLEVFKFSQSVVFFSIETLAIAFVGTVIGAILAIPIGVLASKNITGNVTSKISDFGLILIRTFPEIVLAIILIGLVGPGPFAGAVTIGVHSIGMLGKLYSEAIENMDRGPIEALDAVGASTFQKLRYAVLPNVMPDFFSIILYRFDINIRSSFILGFVFAGGLGAPISYASSERNWEGISVIVIAVMVMVLTIEFISTELRKKLI